MPKRLPRSLKIGGHVFTVTLADPEDMDQPNRKLVLNLRKVGAHFVHYGEVSFEDLAIRLNKNMKPSMATEVLLHEVLHTCIDHAGIGDHIKKGREESVVQSLAAQLTQVLTDNVQFRRLFAR